MAATLQAQWDAAHGPTNFDSTTPQAQQDATHFQQRVSMAMTAAAIRIMGENVSVTNHANRMLLVKAVLGNPQQWTMPFAQAFAAHGFDQSTLDGPLLNGADTLWDGFAGAP